MRFPKSEQDRGYKDLGYRIGALTPVFYTERRSRSGLTRRIRVYRLNAFANSSFGDLEDVTRSFAAAAQVPYDPKAHRIVLRGTGSDLAQDMFEEVFDCLCGKYNVRQTRARAQKID